jgi:hypothetical protein
MLQTLKVLASSSFEGFTAARNRHTPSTICETWNRKIPLPMVRPDEFKAQNQS